MPIRKSQDQVQMISKPKHKKQKKNWIDTLDFKIKNFWTSKNTIKNVKSQATE